MERRAIWKGSIHFGKMDIPVKLHTAVREERVQFNLLHKSDHVRLKQQMICAHENVPVPTEEQIKGFQLDDGRYVLIEEEELKEMEPESSRTIEVHEFVDPGQIDPIFISRGYYLEPDGKSKEYQLLARAMQDLGMLGICSWTMRKREYFGMLEVRSGILRLSTLRYADDVVSTKDLDLPSVKLSEKELAIAGDLIGRLTASFQPEKFINEHQQKLQALIDKKARGEKIAILKPKRKKPTPPDNLLKVLEASLKKVA